MNDESSSIDAHEKTNDVRPSISIQEEMNHGNPSSNSHKNMNDESPTTNSHKDMNIESHSTNSHKDMNNESPTINSHKDMNEECLSTNYNFKTHPEIQDYPLHFNFLNHIPHKAQKGLSTFDVELTCIDADGHYIAIGSNIGIVYLFDRKKNHLSRLRNDHKDVITTVKTIISIEFLVVCGSKNGYVVLFKVPFDSNEQIEKFSVQGLHSSTITSLEWAEDGSRFFSGDENGLVVCTEIDYFEHQSRSRIILNEQSKIVQLSYSKPYLVISTVFRSIIYSCESNTCVKIGQKERKCFGPFGAIISQLNISTEDVIFASRPGQRLWKSNKDGIIEETMIFKSAINEPHPVITLQNNDNKVRDLTDLQFSLLKNYLNEYIIVYSDSSLLLIDPQQKSIVASCTKLDPILDLCINNEEIFILRGVRDLVRLSLYPDPYVCDKDFAEPSLVEELLVPFKELSTFVKERSDSFASRNENSVLFDWLKKKRSASIPSVFVENEKNKVNNHIDSLPQVVELKSDELMPVLIDRETTPLIPAIRISSIDDGDEIVYRRPKKKKQKKVRFRSKSPEIKENSQSQSNTDTVDSNSIMPKVPISSENKQSSSQSNVLSESEKQDSQHTSVLNKHPILTEVTAHSKEQEIASSLNIKNHNEHSADILFGSSSVKSSDNINNNDITTENRTSVGEISKDYNTDKNSNISSEIFNDKSADNSIGNTKTDEKECDPDDIYLSCDLNSPNNKKLFPVPTSDDGISLASEDISLTSDSSTDIDPPKYGVEWIEFKAPELLLDLSISDYHIYCVDVKNKLYVSHYPVLGLHWVELGQPAEKIAVSPADKIIWVLYKRTIYTVLQKSNIKWKDAEWVSIARDIISIAVEDDCGWYVTEEGHLTLQSNLTESKPYSYPETIKSSFDILQITCRDNVLWALSSGGSVHCLNRNSICKTTKWKKIEFEDPIEIDSVYLGVHQTGWIVDSCGIIRFVIGVTAQSPEGIGKPWEVEASKYLMQNMSNFQSTVMKALNNETISSMIKGKQHISLSSSTQGIWFCKTFGSLVYANMKGVIGHSWDTIVPIGTAASTKWSVLAASGFSFDQESLWCVNASKELYCLVLTSNSLVEVALPNITGIQCLVPCAQSLWLLSEEGSIYIRRGIMPNCLEGVWWQNLELDQLGSEKLIHVSCSSEATWACSEKGRIYMRIGTLCPSSDRKLIQAWVPLSSEEEEVNVSPIVERLSSIGRKFPLPLVNQNQNTAELCFLKIYVGPLGYPVWAIDNRNMVFVREGVSNSYPIGTKWISIPELKAKDLCISKGAVWLLKRSGKIFRRFGVTEKNPCGDYWKQIPGLMTSLSVTPEDDLWGVKNDVMLRHSSFLLNCVSSDVSKKLTSRSISEDDWEDIMADDFDSET